MSRIGIIVGAFLLTSLLGQKANAQSHELVNDGAGFLSDSEEQALTNRLLEYEQETTNQIALITVQSLEGTDISTFATEIGQEWGVGQEGDDNGIVIAVAREEREVFIAVGYGLEGVIPDITASRIVRNIITPNFKVGQFYQGLSGAVDEIILRAKGEFVAESGSSDGEIRSASTDTSRLTSALFCLVVLFVIVAVTAGRGGRGGNNHRRRRNDSIIPLMFLMGHMSGRGAGGGGSGFGGGGGGSFGGFGGGGFGGGGAGGGW